MGWRHQGACTAAAAAALARAGDDPPALLPTTWQQLTRPRGRPRPRLASWHCCSHTHTHTHMAQCTRSSGCCWAAMQGVPAVNPLARPSASPGHTSCPASPLPSLAEPALARLTCVSRIRGPRWRVPKGSLAARSLSLHTLYAAQRPWGGLLHTVSADTLRGTHAPRATPALATAGLACMPHQPLRRPDNTHPPPLPNRPPSALAPTWSAQ